jgi:hypothetical protein
MDIPIRWLLSPLLLLLPFLLLPLLLLLLLLLLLTPGMGVKSTRFSFNN